MATMYPAIKAGIGRWTYYMVKMSFNDVAKEVQLASDVHQDRTLDEAIQREVNNSRARQNLVSYLQEREDRFLNSIVVAALGGSPTFTPLQLAETPANQVFIAMEIDQSFGVLTFAGGQRYYALDGQHRLAAVRAILEPTDQNYDRFAREHVTQEFRDQFRNEEISVIMVVQDPQDSNETGEVLKDYRRLFSSLNRYAKATEAHTNIIMDEDDGIAILTRRLIAEHEFFAWPPENQSDHSVVKTTKGKSLNHNDPHFTSIETLYAMNHRFLESATRSAKGWQLTNNEFVPQKDFKKIWQISRPDEAVLDQYYDELANIWDAILAALPDLRRPPTQMRAHNPSDDDLANGHQDHVLFWPIGQEMLAQVVRKVLDESANNAGKEVLTEKEVIDALQPLQKINWFLHEPPWCNLLLVQKTNKSGRSNWAMRDESRKQAVDKAIEVIHFLLGTVQLNQQDQEALKRSWANMLTTKLTESEIEETWETATAYRT